MEPDIDVIELAGRVTQGRDTSELESIVTGIFAAGGRKIIIDLVGVTYIDSSGVGVMAYAASKARGADAKLAITGCGGMVLEVFRITRIDLVVPFFPDIASAVASFSG